MNQFELTDEQLIAKFQDGNIGAYTQLVERYKERLFNFIYRFLYDLDKAEDILQDTFLKLYTHKHSYREIAKFSTWLYTIAGNLAKTELRKLKRRKTYSISDLSRYDNEFVIKSPDGSAEVDAASITNEESIQHALNQLPTNFKTILSLVALIQALVVTLEKTDFYSGTHIQILQSNKWQAARYGLEGIFVNPKTIQKITMRKAIEDLYTQVKPAFDSLGSSKYIKTVEEILNQDTGSTKQRKLYNSSKDFNYMLKSLKELFYQ